jgi:hypothetical protein
MWTNKTIERLKEGPKAAGGEISIIRAFNSINLSFRYDDESGGIFAIDQGGLLLTKEELKELTEGLNIFFDHWGDDAIREHNDEASEKNKQPEYHYEVTAKAPPRKGWIYVVEGLDSQYKIGLTTRQPSQRLAEFTPKLPFPTNLLLTIPTDDVLGHEKAIHDRFADKRLNGEWFELSEHDILWLRAGAR